MSSCPFEVDYRCPVKLEYLSDYVTTAVNAAAVVTDFKWEDIVKSLIDQAHIRAYMPSYTTCVTDMLRVNGFVSVPNIRRMRDLAVEQSKDGVALDKYVIRVLYHEYFAVIPNSENDGYCLKGIKEPRRDLTDSYIEACWRYEPGTDNRTGIKRDGFAMPGITEPHKNLEVINMNPQDHNVGDCSVRALCAALECTWDEAVDLLAKANHYTDPIINSLPNINNALIGLDFERHKALRFNGRLLSGKQFCDRMTYTYHNGERIFAFVGRSHCAAILPFREADGMVRYKAQDTWDSTDRKIGDYWVIPSKTNRQTKTPKEDRPTETSVSLEVGNIIKHQKFGEGIILNAEGDIVTVGFNRVGTKKLSKEWLLNTLKMK